MIFLTAAIIREPGEATEEAMRRIDKADQERAEAALARAEGLQQEGEYQEALDLLAALGEPKELDIVQVTRDEIVAKGEELLEIVRRVGENR